MLRFTQHDKKALYVILMSLQAKKNLALAFDWELLFKRYDAI